MASLAMIALLVIFAINLVKERVAVATHPQVLASAKWSTKRCAEEPKFAVVNFSLW
jgi:hypothetical protein